MRDVFCACDVCFFVNFDLLLLSTFGGDFSAKPTLEKSQQQQHLCAPVFFPFSFLVCVCACVCVYVCVCVLVYSQTLAREYGLYLREKNRHDEAGVMFIRGQHWNEAQEAFVAALDWRQAMCMAAQQELGAAGMVELARSLAG